MKKILLSLCLLALAGMLFAVEAGKNMPRIYVSEWYARSKTVDGPLESFTLFDINAADAIPMLRMLETLQDDFKIPFTAIAINDAKSVEPIIKASNPFRINLGTDTNLRTRNLIAETESLFPYSVLAKEGKVIWTGHPSELESIIPQIQTNQFSLSNQRKIETLRRELQMAIQSGLPDVVSQTADKILKISPSDRIAIQAKLIALNAGRRQAEIPAFIQKVCRQNPNDIRLRLMELDLLLQQGKTAEFTNAVNTFARNFPKPDHRLIQPTAYIIDHAPFGSLSPALTMTLAKRSYDSIAQNPAVKGTTNHAIACETLARAYAQTGKFPEAIKLQEQAVAIRKGTPQEALAQQRLKYYRQLQIAAR